MFDVSQWLAQRLHTEAVPASEAPMRYKSDGKSYITWQITTPRTSYASGLPMFTFHGVTVTLWALESENWRESVERIRAALAAGGRRVTFRLGGAVWDETIKRREVTMYVRVTEDMQDGSD